MINGANGGLRALVLSGGGAKGCWQAGAMLALAERGRLYDGYFGVSVGAINAAHMAQYERGQTLEAALDLRDMWHGFSNRDVWRHHNRWLRWLAVPWHRSVYDSSPLRSYLARHLDVERVRTSGTHVEVGSVSLGTGEYILTLGNDPHFADAVYASAAFPVMFEAGAVSPHSEVTDGGLVHVTPLRAAIKWGATRIDVVMLDPPGIARWTPPRRSWWEPRIHDTAVRVVDILLQHVIEDDLTRCHRVNQRVTAGRGDPDHRYIHLNVFRPEAALSVDSLDFDPEAMARGFSLGYEYADLRLQL